MTPALTNLVQQIFDLSKDDRVEVLRAVLGTGLLPEARDSQTDDEPLQYKVQGVVVDEETYRFVDQTMGIFQVEQLGMSPQRVLDAFESEKTLRWQQANLTAVLKGDPLNWGYTRDRDLSMELRKLGEFVGIDARDWEVPAASHIAEAIMAGGFKAPQKRTYEDWVQEGRDQDLDEQLRRAEKMVFGTSGSATPLDEPLSGTELFLELAMPIIEVNFTNGDPPEITARELFDCTELGLLQLCVSTSMADDWTAYAANIAALVPVAGQDYVRAVRNQLSGLVYPDPPQYNP